MLSDIKKVRLSGKVGEAARRMQPMGVLEVGAVVVRHAAGCERLGGGLLDVE